MQIGKISSVGNNMYVANAAYTTNRRGALQKASAEKTNNASRKDTANFSMNAKRIKGANLIQTLVDRKKNLQEQKEKLMEDSKEKDIPSDLLKEQLDALNEEIEQINEQITQHMISAVTATTQEEKEKLSGQQQKGNGQKDGMSSILTASSSLENARIASRTPRQSEVQAQILESEDLLDKNVAYKTEITLATSPQKILESDELKDQASQLTGEVLEQVSQIDPKPAEKENPVQSAEQEFASGLMEKV